MYDKIDKRIVAVLKKEENINISRLTLKSFPRESNIVFRARLERLRKKNIIVMNGGPNKKFTGNNYIIKLKDKNRKL